MKTTKRVLSVVLVLMLALGISAPAAAQEAEVNPMAPVITREPNWPSSVRVGQTIVLDIEAELPPGVEGELSIQWILPGYSSNEPQIQWRAEWRDLLAHHQLSMSVFVTNTWVDEHDQERTSSVRLTESLNVRPTWWQYIILVPLSILLTPISTLGTIIVFIMLWRAGF